MTFTFTGPVVVMSPVDASEKRSSQVALLALLPPPPAALLLLATLLATLDADETLDAAELDDELLEELAPGHAPSVSP